MNWKSKKEWIERMNEWVIHRAKPKSVNKMKYTFACSNNLRDFSLLLLLLHLFFLHYSAPAHSHSTSTATTHRAYIVNTWVDLSFCSLLSDFTGKDFDGWLRRRRKETEIFQKLLVYISLLFRPSCVKRTTATTTANIVFCIVYFQFKLHTVCVCVWLKRVN